MPSGSTRRTTRNASGGCPVPLDSERRSRNRIARERQACGRPLCLGDALRLLVCPETAEAEHAGQQRDERAEVEIRRGRNAGGGRPPRQHRLRDAGVGQPDDAYPSDRRAPAADEERSEDHTSELQSLMRTSNTVFCLTQKNREPAIQPK